MLKSVKTTGYLSIVDSWEDFGTNPTESPEWASWSGWASSRKSEWIQEGQRNNRSLHSLDGVAMLQEQRNNSSLHSLDGLAMSQEQRNNRRLHILDGLANGRPDSSVDKTVCLCLTTSYIPLPQGFESRWQHASKKKIMSSEKNISMKIPAESMRGLTVPVGLRWFHRVLPGQPRTTLTFLHLKTVVQNASLLAELLGWRRFRK